MVSSMLYRFMCIENERNLRLRRLPPRFQKAWKTRQCATGRAICKVSLREKPQELPLRVPQEQSHIRSLELKFITDCIR